jgi:hypothetical protein
MTVRRGPVVSAVTAAAVPTAMQAVVAGQDTFSRKVAGCGFTGDSSDQDLPFQCAASAFSASFQPTAVQFPVAGQVTPSSSPVCLVVCADHLFSCRSSARPG